MMIIPDVLRSRESLLDIPGISPSVTGDIIVTILRESYFLWEFTTRHVGDDGGSVDGGGGDGDGDGDGGGGDGGDGGGREARTKCVMRRDDDDDDDDDEEVGGTKQPPLVAFAASTSTTTSSLVPSPLALENHPRIRVDGRGAKTSSRDSLPKDSKPCAWMFPVFDENASSKFRKPLVREKREAEG
ncbi:hypothetical protein HZH68_003730 [Vespula germanica]|uniref:Uncharacterized protein n=1 Tax=Vespula germanica TaxID=30212 RepID=A0A834U3L8_VESGE|nr:hypothetical protein HZH68_003730 [Vespula germanica]